MSNKSEQNPFYEKIRREGYRIKLERPEPKIPPTNPYYERVKDGVCVKPGRPRKGESEGPTEIRSIRLPPSVWEKVEDQAAREGLSVHAAVRHAVLIWLRS